MIKKAILGWNAAPGAPRDWDPKIHGECGALPIRVFPPAAARNPSLAQHCESAWEPTPTELEWLNQGGHLVLKVIGWQIPVALYCEPPTEEQAIGRSQTILEFASRQIDECRQLLANALNIAALIAQNSGLGLASVKELTDAATGLGHIEFGNLEHAPNCPANHLGRTRIPTGPCGCGAQADADKANEG